MKKLIGLLVLGLLVLTACGESGPGPDPNAPLINPTNIVLVLVIGGFVINGIIREIGKALARREAAKSGHPMPVDEDD